MLKNTSQDLPSLPLSLSDTWFTDADVQISVMWCHVVYPLDPTDMAGPAEPAEESTDTLKLCPREQFLKLCKERAGEVLRAGVEKIIGHLCLLIDLTLRKSKFS